MLSQNILNECVSITAVELSCFIPYPLHFRVIVIAPAFAPRYDNNRGHSRCNYYAGTIIILFVSCVRVRLSPIGVGIIGNI